MSNALVITSIANDKHAILKQYAQKCQSENVSFILIGDKRSPDSFKLKGCDFYSIEKQNTLPFKLASKLPTGHYARKNLGYLIAALAGHQWILETDDDNIAMDYFWKPAALKHQAQTIENQNWVNIYTYYSKAPIWPRGFGLSHLPEVLYPSRMLQHVKELGLHNTTNNTKTKSSAKSTLVTAPIQQYLANDNPDVDAIYRLTGKLPITFKGQEKFYLTGNSVCPFNSQATKWERSVFPLMYLPSYCSFRMTDIWRSFIASRICRELGIGVLFGPAAMSQIRNDHNLLRDFSDEISGYLNNEKIVAELNALSLKPGKNAIGNNLLQCYQKMVELGLVDKKEIPLVKAWILDCNFLGLL